MGLEWEYTVEQGKESLKTSGPLQEAISVLVSGHHPMVGGDGWLKKGCFSMGITYASFPALLPCFSCCLQLVPREEAVRSSLMYRYIIHEDLLPLISNNNVLLEEMDSYEWALKSWSQCSKACGGGTFSFVL